MTKEQLTRSIGTLLGIVLFGAALWIVHHELKRFSYHEVVEHLAQIPTTQIALALALTILNYLALTGYDTLAIRYVGKRLAYHRIALASFVAYVFSHNVGLSFLGGSAVRYRLFSFWGLTPADIARVIAFTGMTFWLGACGLGGLVLTFDPLMLPHSLRLAIDSSRPLGIVLLVILGVYLPWSITRKMPVRIHGFEIEVPTLRITFAQLILSAADWALAASVLYVLLPHTPGLSPATFLGGFLIAQILGFVSNVPAGLGVFDGMILFLLSPYIPADAILGSLVAYRVIYYLLPLLLGVTLLGCHEALRQRDLLVTTGTALTRLVPEVLPLAFAVSSFVGGLILLLSGATPAETGRIAWLHHFLPLPVMEVSHIVGSLAGAGLILLAHALQQRVHAAYFATLALLGVGIVASLLKGIDFEEAIILSIILAAFLPCRYYFDRKTSLIGEAFPREWLIAIVFVVAGAAWLNFWVHRHVPYSHELWWQFELFGDASRAMRAGLGVILFGLVYAFARLVRLPRH